MFYIFDKNNECIASCSFEPDLEDLKSRDETLLEFDSDIADLSILRNDNGKIKLIEHSDKELSFDEVVKNVREKILNYKNNLDNRNIKYNNKEYQADNESVNKLILAKNLNEEIEWKTFDNSFETLTTEDISNILNLIAKRNSDNLYFISSIKDKVNKIIEEKENGNIPESEAKEMLNEAVSNIKL